MERRYLRYLKTLEDIKEHIKLNISAEELFARNRFSKMMMEIEAKEKKAKFDYNKTILNRKIRDLEEENFGLKYDNEKFKNQIDTLNDDKKKLLERIRELEEMVKKL